MGAVLCVLFAKFFLTQYPVLRIDKFSNPTLDAGKWQSAMTFKFVGAIRSLGPLADFKVTALKLGFSIGLVTEIARKLLARTSRYQRFLASGALGFSIGWIVDAILLSSPYASSFGAFVDLSAAIWFAVGGVLTSALARGRPAKRPPEETGDELPEDMSSSSLIGGGLIAGESLYTLAVGIIALLSLLH
jgi:hypothetical protein